MTRPFVICAEALRAGDVIPVLGTEATVLHSTPSGGFQAVTISDGGGEWRRLFKAVDLVPVIRFAPATDAEFQGL